MGGPALSDAAVVYSYFSSVLFHWVDRITWLVQSLLPDIWAVLHFSCYERRAEHSRTSHAEDPRFLLLDTHLGVEYMGVRVDMCSTLVISYKLFPNHHLCHSTPTPSDALEPHLSTELNVFESLQAGPLPVPKLDLVSTLKTPSHSSMEEKDAAAARCST